MQVRYVLKQLNICPKLLSVDLKSLASKMHHIGEGGAARRRNQVNPLTLFCWCKQWAEGGVGNFTWFPFIDAAPLPSCIPFCLWGFPTLQRGSLALTAGCLRKGKAGKEFLQQSFLWSPTAEPTQIIFWIHSAVMTAAETETANKHVPKVSQYKRKASHHAYF